MAIEIEKKAVVCQTSLDDVKERLFALGKATSIHKIDTYLMDSQGKVIRIRHSTKGEGPNSKSKIVLTTKVVGQIGDAEMNEETEREITEQEEANYLSTSTPIFGKEKTGWQISPSGKYSSLNAELMKVGDPASGKQLGWFLEVECVCAGETMFTQGQVATGLIDQLIKEVGLSDKVETRKYYELLGIKAKAGWW